MRSSHYKLMALVFGAVTILGCYGRPGAVEVPHIDADSAAEDALSKYDTNGDSKLSKDELKNCPSLLSAIGSFDKNNDKSIDKEELTDRLAMWTNSGLGVSNLACRVFFKGRPLSGANVELIPEDFLHDVVKPAKGVTQDSGSAQLGIDSAFLPDDLKRLKGVHQGLYRVVITHPDIEIPSKYNADTELGLEVSYETGKNMVEFKL
ncbi:EF-hand domain-containing protein [Bythopirellula polymerisocia]|uniref:EF hand n=1 Tax=Bythopirellula polymerisocia TaxID=2528003 RepID=A0A5C6CTM3_9BACT|nr:EF-hand domain-containing protein [Bythopirellula polymerisocia]TWU26089.1 EF hand [Bythopirellula polymerisocia]